jgi:hypothetical protein
MDIVVSAVTAICAVLVVFVIVLWNTLQQKVRTIEQLHIEALKVELRLTEVVEKMVHQNMSDKTAKEIKEELASIENRLTQIILRK